MITVVCAVIIQKHRVLATQRGPGQDRPGKWEFPGGKVQPGESETRALEREIDEELQVKIRPGYRLTPVIHHYPNVSICLIPYLCRLSAGEITLSEHSAYRWCTADELEQLDWAEADRPVVREVVERWKDEFSPEANRL